MFLESTKLDWPAVTKIAMEFEPNIKEKWPSFWEEMNGLAEGAGSTLADIIAINVRTEINYGLFSDGCTSLSWKMADSSYLAQNWDWREEQAENLILLTIKQADKPVIKTMTEAGIIGKIGFNSAGVGVCLNAITARGISVTRIPCHLGLRLALECNSKEEALGELEKHGVASSCHYLLADGSTGGIGLEWSATDCQRLSQDLRGIVLHSNHYVLPHPGVDENFVMSDSLTRLTRIKHLVGQTPSESLGFDTLFGIFKDEENLPTAICREYNPPDSVGATLFNIIMELRGKNAVITIGRPSDSGERIEVSL